MSVLGGRVSNAFMVVNPSMVMKLPWPEALAKLQELLPECDSFWPDGIGEAARIAGFPVEFVPMIEAWEAMEDSEIFQTILPKDFDDSEPTTIVTEGWYFKHDGPFQLDGGDFFHFVETYPTLYGESCVNGDTVILLPVRMSIVIFHHEGYHATIRCGSPTGATPSDAFDADLWPAEPE